jgi:excisionase family DNA binding protein
MIQAEAKQGQERLLFSKSEAAYSLNISVRKIDYLIAEKALKTRRIGRRVLITRKDLQRFANGQ